MGDSLDAELRTAESLKKNFEAKENTVQRKLDRLIKRQNSTKTGSDAVDIDLQRQVAEMKEKVNCPVCHKKEKNAILEKCLHTFCYDCLKKRYDVRQRKCPKCGQPFGKQDIIK